MKIYLLYERLYDDGDFVDCNVYPYQKYEDVIQRVMDETGKSKFEVAAGMSLGDCTVTAGNFEYGVEETELL